MKTSRFICMVLAVAMVLSLNIFQFESIHAEDKIYATTSSPAIPVTVGEAINLEDVMVEFSSMYTSELRMSTLRLRMT